MTITDALQLVPEYILLRPGAKLNRGTDEYIEHYAGEEFFHQREYRPKVSGLILFVERLHIYDSI